MEVICRSVILTYTTRFFFFHFFFQFLLSPRRYLYHKLKRCFFSLSCRPLGGCLGNFVLIHRDHSLTGVWHLSPFPRSLPPRPPTPNPGGHLFPLPNPTFLLREREVDSHPLIHSIIPLPPPLSPPSRKAPTPKLLPSPRFLPHAPSLLYPFPQNTRKPKQKKTNKRKKKKKKKRKRGEKDLSPY